MVVTFGLDDSMSTKTKIEMPDAATFYDAAWSFCRACGIDPEAMVSQTMIDRDSLPKESAMHQIATEMALLKMRMQIDEQKAS